MLHLQVITNDSCGCCHDFLKTLGSYTKAHSDVTFSEDDMSHHKDKQIKGLPYTIVYKNNVEVGTILGNISTLFLEEELKKYQMK